MNFRTRIANSFSGLVLRTLFRPSYTPSFMRRSFDIISGVSAEVLERKFPGVKFIPGSVGGIPTETVQTGEPTLRRILFAHGGGYFMGSITAYRRNALRLAYRCQAEVTIFNYRLAPEHPYPAALEDAKAVYLDLLQAEPKQPLILGGDSAGGGLALATTLALRDEGLPLPAGVFCLSPWADLTGSQPSIETNAKRDVWLSRQHLVAWSAWYSGIHDQRIPLISPLFADFEGFPPLLIMVGDQEVLLGESVAIVEKIKALGGKAKLHLGIGMQHDWPFSLPGLPASKQAMKTLAVFIAGI